MAVFLNFRPLLGVFLMACRILCLFFLTISLIARPLDVEMHADRAILMNGKTGAILYEKKAHVPSYPASTTKIATALFILDHKKPELDRCVVVSEEALKLKPLKGSGDCPAYWGEVDGATMGLLKGEILSLETLLHGLLMVSGNDAANTLAASLAPTIPEFVEEMNQYVFSLGCRNTQFRNPHGLHHPEHFTTAYDLCLMMKKALQIPKFRELISKFRYLKPKTNRQPAANITANLPLIKPGGPYYDPKILGGKTGFHSQAMYTLVTAAESEDRLLIAALLGCSRREDRYEDAAHLFEAAFAEVQETRRIFGPERIFSREIPEASSPLVAALDQELQYSFYPAEEPQCKAALHWDPVSLPVNRGQKVGWVEISDERGNLLVRGDLVAQEEVQRTFLSSIKHLFRKALCF